MSYCDVSLVKTITGLDSSEIRDQRIRDVRDDVAVPRLNDDVQTRVDKERVKEIDDDKPNTIDGDNTTFYLREVHNSFRELGDLNDDATIDSNDIIAWAISGEERIEVEVQSVDDPREGEFTAVQAGNGEPLPNGCSLYVSYRHAPVNVADPNQMVAIACAQLTGAFCFSNIETSKLKNFTIGDVTIRKQTEGFSIMMDQYTESMRRIVNRELIKFDENENEIEEVIKKHYAGDDILGRGKRTYSGRFRSG